MKHHFADLLDRSGGYWTITPNAQRWSCHFSDLNQAPRNTTRLTVTRSDKNWRQIRDFQELTELTLHEPGQEQLAHLAELPKLRALRISHARPKTLTMLRGHSALRELVLEYVSNVRDLQPLGQLPSLTALHLENLRNVSDFSALTSSSSLRYLSINGTVDWSQPIQSFNFLATLTSLEHLTLCFIRAPATPLSLKPLLELGNLSRLEIGGGELPLEDFAWLEANLAHVEGAVRPSYFRYGGEDCELNPGDVLATMPIEEFNRLSGVYVGKEGKRYKRVPYQAYLLGKGERHVSGTDEHVREKCAAHERKYRDLVKRHLSPGIG